ncbi:MAG: YonK family protein [Candidatus Kurthia intestinigallinarum]
MSKAAITQKLSLSATGILDIDDDGVYIENLDTGELIDFKDLLSEFADKSVKLSVTYDYDYGTDNNEN